jgi:hypothetical protein
LIPCLYRPLKFDSLLSLVYTPTKEVRNEAKEVRNTTKEVRNGTKEVRNGAKEVRITPLCWSFEGMNVGF